MEIPANAGSWEDAAAIGADQLAALVLMVALTLVIAYRLFVPSLPLLPGPRIRPVQHTIRDTLDEGIVDVQLIPLLSGDRKHGYRHERE